eukprot:COSAG01_NODE_43119_length_433_cov_0.703593_1_plen_117_part_10
MTRLTLLSDKTRTSDANNANLAATARTLFPYHDILADLDCTMMAVGDANMVGFSNVHVVAHSNIVIGGHVAVNVTSTGGSAMLASYGTGVQATVKVLAQDSLRLRSQRNTVLASADS